jgi:hypothetical protein
MTQHVRKGYGNHRRGFWAAVVVLAAVCAAVVTPFATGAPPKHYTLTAPPDSLCFTGPGQPQSFDLTLTNQARNNTLGSANITAPPNFISLTAGTLLNAPAGSMLDGNTIKLRNLALATQGDAITVSVSATIESTGTGEWVSVVKQSNDFADAPGPGNLFALQPDSSPPLLTVAACQYAFTQGPVDAQKNVAQTVKVQLLAGTTPVGVTGPLTLSAFQTIGGTTTSASSSFNWPLTSAAQDTTKTWSFSVTGTVSGAGYSLRAGSGAQATDSDTFTIYDCVPTGTSGTCDIPFTPTEDGTSGASVSGTGIGSPIALSFETIPEAGKTICNTGWGWSPLEYPDPTEPDGTANFDGLVLSDFTYAPGNNGSLLVTTYLRNDLYVMTNPSNTNDIQICAGARHAHSDNATTQGSTERAFMGRDGIKAMWDTSTELYWGVLARIPNCNRARDLSSPTDGILDPALCAWGTTDIEGVTYRTATVLVPYDWDWKGIT